MKLPAWPLCGCANEMPGSAFAMMTVKVVWPLFAKVSAEVAVNVTAPSGSEVVSSE